MEAEFALVALLDEAHKESKLDFVLQHLLILEERQLVEEALRDLVKLAASEPWVT